MRHLLSLVLGVILAPLIYILVGVSESKLFEGLGVGGKQVQIVPELIAVLCALAAGGLYAVLVLVRLSPVGTVLAGLILFFPTLWMIVAYQNFSTTLPESFLGVRGALQSGAGGLVIMASIPLLLTVLSPRRWRSSAQPAAGAYVAPTYGTATPSAVYQPAGTPYSGAPAYQSAPPGSPATPTYTPPTYTPPSYAAPADTTIQSPTVE
jgi:hypothetical protein